MSVVEPGSTGGNLIARIKSLLTQPTATWQVIDVEPATVGGLYKSWVIPLAAIPAVCGFIGMVVFGVSVMGFSYKPSIPSALTSAIVQYALSLGGVFVTALVIDALAPTFGGAKNQVQAFKLVAYASVAAWISGVFQLLPALGILVIPGALYSLFLLYKGLPILMKTPDDKALPYTVLILIVAAVVNVVVMSVAGAAMNMAGGGAAGAMSRNAGTGVLTTPGGGSVDLGKLEAASKQMEAAAKQMQSGAEGGASVAMADPGVLKGFLPASVAGYALESSSSASGGAGGMTTSSAKALYKKGDAQITVTVTDMGAAGALAAMAGAFNVHSSSEENGRYEKMGKVDGRTTIEQYDRNSGHGEYSVFAGDRFMIQAEGEKASVDELKSAVAAVGPGRLEKLSPKG